MVSTAQNSSATEHVNPKVEPLPQELDPLEICVPLLPISDEEQNGVDEKPYNDNVDGNGTLFKQKEIVLGKNVRSSCLAITEPDADDELTGDREGYMASVLAKYRRSLIERTKHHLAYMPCSSGRCRIFKKWVPY